MEEEVSISNVGDSFISVDNNNNDSPKVSTHGCPLTFAWNICDKKKHILTQTQAWARGVSRIPALHWVHPCFRTCERFVTEFHVVIGVLMSALQAKAIAPQCLSVSSCSSSQIEPSGNQWLCRPCECVGRNTMLFLKLWLVYGMKNAYEISIHHLCFPLHLLCHLTDM